MKNLNKVLAMLVVFMMMLSTVAFASSFTDVAVESSYSTAIEVGVDLGLFKGYEDGTFKPEGEITRAEFAAIVVRLLGQEAQAAGAKAATQFVDVPADHWAAGYVNIAVQAGVINGYGDGNFGPEDLVEYQDAITMMVRALGYEPAIGSAGYPTGYLTKAGELGLTTGVNGSNGVAANRGAVAQIAFNALDVPLMTQSGYGTFTQYVINDGYSTVNGTNNGVKKTLLSENHSVVKVQGTIKSSSDTVSANKNAKEYVDVDVINAYNNKFGTAINGKMFVGDSDAMNYVGKKVILFVEYDEFTAEKTIKALYEVNTDVLTIDLADVVTWENGEIKYYVNDSKTTTTTISSDANVFYNGIKTDVPASLLDMSGTIELSLLDNETTDADYDTVYVTAYDVFVVDEVVATSKRVTSKITPLSFNGRISFNEDEGDVKATLVDANGAAMEWTDLEEYDVLSVKYVDTGVKKIYEAKVIENTVTGTVTSSSGNFEDGDTEKYIEIDGVEYKVLEVAEGEDEIKLGDEGTYYLDDSNNVIYHSATITRNNNYAYVIDSQPADEMDNAKVKVLTKENGIVTVEVANKITVSYKEDKVTNVSVKDFATSLASKDADMAAALANDGFDSFDDIEGKVVTYKLNASGQVSAVEIPSINDQNEDYLTASVEGDLIGYDEDAASFRFNGPKHYLTENTVVFYVYGSDDEDYEVVALNNLSEDDDLEDAVLYDVDDDRYIGAIVIKGFNSFSPAVENATFVTKVSTTTDEDGYDVYRVIGYKGFEEVSYIAEDEPVGIVGKLVIPSYKANGDVDEFVVVPNESIKDEDKDIDVVAGVLNIYEDGGEWLSPIDTRRKNIVVNGEEYKISSSVAVYAYDNDATTRNKHKVDVGMGYVEFDVTDKVNGAADLYIDGEESNATVTVYMYIYDGDVVDVLYYID